MGNGENNGICMFPLTSLQIGDLQSYLSHISLFLAPESKRFYILVDNRPWLEDLISRPAHFWQFMVTKSRLSPFANTRARKRKNESRPSSRNDSKNLKRWFYLVDAAVSSRNRALLPVKKLKTLYGFIVFEVSWSDVRGINYFNQLQTDTSLAIEAKIMKRWEFDSIEQASRCRSSWFSGTRHEQFLLNENLDSMIEYVFYDAQECLPTTVDNESPYYTFCPSDCEETIETTQYKDALILFRFNDRDLPFKLKETIMSDLRLLTLLESGLPSWALFFQSYPVFCHIYRPWMCPLARALYVLISIVTVLIGFYDLYKNVPVLKATASRLCGPLFDWIETWEMVSRIKYLGTMLFLHNFQKAVKWCLTVTRTLKSAVSILTKPMEGPFMDLFDFLSPLCNLCVQVAGSFSSVLWIMIGSSCSLIENLVEIVLLPVWFILSSFWSIVMSVIYPLFWILWEIVYAPFRLVLGFASLVAFIHTSVNDVIKDIWVFASSIVKFASDAEETVTTYEVSMWRSLWNDLFSQVFRAIRSILNGFVAFFTACNRHRLSIYNHVIEFIRRLSHQATRLRPTSSSHRPHTRGFRNSLVDGDLNLHQLKSRKQR